MKNAMKIMLTVVIVILVFSGCNTNKTYEFAQPTDAVSKIEVVDIPVSSLWCSGIPIPI